MRSRVVEQACVRSLSSSSCFVYITIYTASFCDCRVVGQLKTVESLVSTESRRLCSQSVIIATLCHVQQFHHPCTCYCCSSARTPVLLVLCLCAAAAFTLWSVCKVAMCLGCVTALKSVHTYTSHIPVLTPYCSNAYLPHCCCHAHAVRQASLLHNTHISAVLLLLFISEP